jgi:hypothetical protein
VSATIGSERLSGFTSWARSKKRRAFLGELGTGTNSTCLSAVNDMLKHVEQNADVYLGWTWWSAGPWWNNYFLGLDPVGGADRPQMTALEPHISWEGSATNCPPSIWPPAAVLPEAGAAGAGGTAGRKDGGGAGSAGGPKSDAAVAAGGAGGTDPPPEEETEETSSPSGCKCGAAGSTRTVPWWLAAVGVSLGLRGRRRRV